MRKRYKMVVLLLVVGLSIALLLGACAQPPAVEEPAVEVAATEAPAEEMAEGPTEADVSKEGESSSGEAGTAQTVKIGMALGLSGAQATEAEMMQRGVELWKQRVNESGGIQVGDQAYVVDMIYYDDKSDAETSAKLTERMITEDDVDFIFGPFSSGFTMHTSTVAERYNTLNFGTMANSSEIYNRDYKYVFSILPPAGNYMRAFLDMAAQQDPKPESVALLVRDDPFGISIAEGTVAYAGELGLEVVYEQKFPKEPKDVSALLTAIKPLNPDIIIGATTLPEAVLITRQAKELDINPLALAFTVGPTLPGFVESLGDDAEYIFGSEWWLPEMGWEGRGPFESSVEFGELFEEAYEQVPSYHAAGSAAAGVLLQLCMEDTGSIETDVIRDCLLNFDETIFWGPTAYNENGENAKGGSGPIQIQDGQVVSVYPPEFAEGEAIWPMPAWNER